MRLKPQAWFVVSLLLFASAICLWQLMDKSSTVGRQSPTATTATPQPPLLNQPTLIKTVATNAIAKRKSYRITNTTQKMAQLLHNSHALILRNALIDTEVPVALKIPDHLRAKGAPGSYLVQADRPLDNAFYAELNKAGATYISYVPNNAALIQATPTQATNLAANADVIAVLPYEPYYKLDSTLLPTAVEQEPQTNALSVTTFPGQRDAALAALTQLGATLIGEDRSPFGPTLIVNVPEKSLVAVAQMPLAQEIEVHTPRRIMNDLTRVIMSVANNPLIGTSNYLGLTGAKVTVNLNDTGVDATHKDLTGRVLGDTFDFDGHGTHVAGIIAGNGSQSTTVIGPVPGSATNASFRGKATNATLFVQALDLLSGPFVSDAFLQENASVNLGPTNLISNNSWDYGSTVYDMNAASYDAATRDAQPNVDGEQPLLFVFAAGNNGNAPSDDGLEGDVGSINSPATAKNVITVGASDSPRFLTNMVSYDGVTTNEVFYGGTDNSNLVAYFSSCGNVDVGIEGAFGRFKPDVIAPGVFTVSCRAHDYIFPAYETYVTEFSFVGQSVAPGRTNTDNGGYAVYLPEDPFGFTASGLTVVISSNATSPMPFPTNMMLLADTFYPPTTVVATNFIANNGYNLTGFNPGDLWYFGIASPANQPGPVNYDLSIYLFETNYLGDYFTVLEGMNSVLGTNYLYQSGTSMSAGAVSGFLALMQEFLQSHTSYTNPSPALLKAMLINGSRSLGVQYDFNINTEGANEQGWGLPNLTNSLPTGLTNAKPSMVLFDQSRSNALATGQYKTFTINCTDSNAATLYPLRVSLVWTDPPGNPAAGVALVNSLELSAVDGTGTNIFIGNDFLSGDTFTEVSSPTNLPSGQGDNDVENVYVNNSGTVAVTSAGDSINNVQNIYINPANVPITFPLTVTVSGTRVNVNAVTTQTNNILQDYALVISSDDPALTAPLTVTPNLIATNLAPLITTVSNGVPLLHERVGANEPNLYNFTLGDTNGSLAQWHFFIFTNSLVTISNETNVAFATFLPPNLSIPRVSGTADIDLYVYAPLVPLPDFSSFLLTPGNLDVFAFNAVKSVGRTGTESIIFTNSTIPVYYIGVKSEDQQASDFGFYGVAQQAPFSSTSADGNTVTATGTSLPVVIPDATSPTPALAFAFMFDPNPVLTKIRRATVTLGVQYPTANDLVGTVQFADLTTVLHTYASLQDSGFTNTYDDLQENPNSGDVTSIGPGSLTQYINQDANGLWLLTEASKAIGESGFVTTYSVSVDLQQPSTGFFITIPPQSWFDDYVDVPNDATNMIIYALYESEGTNNAGVGPVGIYLTNEVGAITTSDYGSNNINPPGGSLSLSTNFPVIGWPGAPPLAGGYWYYGIYNSGSQPVTLFIEINIEESLTPNLVQTYTNNGVPLPLTTDAHTQSTICITNGQQLVDLQVGLRVSDTNLDDLVIHLTSPEGTSVLLIEDRGGTNANGLGLSVVSSNGTTNLSTNYVYTVFTEDTNLTTTPIKFAPPPYAADDITPPATLFSNSFETVAAGVYTNGAILEGWVVTNNVVETQTNGTNVLLTNNEVGIVNDPNGEIIGSTNLGTNYLALTSGHILQTFGVTNKFGITNGMPYELVFYAKPLGLTNWWPANNNADDVINTNNGTIPYSDVTYTNGTVGQGWNFSGVGKSPGYTGNEVDFGTNAGNFGTNNFTVEFWIRQSPSIVNEQACLEKRSVCQGIISFWEIQIGGGNVGWGYAPAGHLKSYIPTDGGTPVGEIVSSNAVNDGFYHHAALVRRAITGGATYSYYIDGLPDTNVTTLGAIANLQNSDIFRAGQSVCVSPGEGGSDATHPFDGNLDELSLYNRALSPAEIYAIYHAGSLGKFNTNSLLPNFNLTIDGVSTNTIILTNFTGGWELITNTFYASNNQVTIEFSGNPMGVLLDDIQLIQVAATNYNNYYLPEEPLTPFIGENPLGCWTLDIWDTRQDSSQPTDGSLLGWTLQMTTSSTNATLYVLSNDVSLTITNLSANAIAYFAIDVPSYVTYATNILTANSGGPLELLFDQIALPTGGLPGDFTLIPSVSAGSKSDVLSFLGLPPPLIPGQRYFLGVLNDSSTTASFTVQVNFNISTNKIIPLTNTIAFTNVVGTNGNGTNATEYYSFAVPTNAVLVTFQILNSTNGEVDLYAHLGLPVPGPLLFDYESCNAGTNDQFIAITTNSLPVPLQAPSTNIAEPNTATTWYLAAYNFAGTNAENYVIIATVVTNGGMDIIPLTNAIPFTNTAPPGYPTNLVYSYTASDNPTGIQFAVTNLTGTGNVELLASLDGFPTPQEYLAGSFNSGTSPQIIQIVPSASLPSLNGIWYLTVPNTSYTPVKYSITVITNFVPAKSLTWAGTVNDHWDVLTTSNWVITGSTSNSVYQNYSILTFDDTAAVTTVDLTTALYPASLTFTNTLTYTLGGIGSISGASLTLSNTGTVIINNSSANNFASVTINAGILEIGTKGSLGTSPVDTGSGATVGPGTLEFNQTINTIFPNVISDNGALVQSGTGALTLSGVNTYAGNTTIAAGTLVVENTSSLGTGSEVLIDSGGTLDLGGFTYANGPGSPLFDGKIFQTAGAGAAGNGAIVNNGIYQQQGGLEAIKLATNTTIGGTTRWDVRNGQDAIALHGYTLTKTGGNQISLVDTAFDQGNIVINQGILSLEGTPDTSTSLSITVNSNGLLGQNLDSPGSIVCPIILNGGGTTNLSGGGITYLDAPIALSNNSSLGNGGGVEIFNGIISGAFGLTNLGVGANLLSATNTYSGSTVVAQGTLALTNTGSITNSTNITVAFGATLDASQRVDQTLALASNQTLNVIGTVLGNNLTAGAGSSVSVGPTGQVSGNITATGATMFLNGTVGGSVTANLSSILYGNGTVQGNLMLDASSTMSPGSAAGTIGTLTVGGTALLGGATYVEIYAAMPPAIQSNDVLSAGTIVYGGALVVTNLGSTNGLVAGASFQIFNSPTCIGAFNFFSLPALPAGLAWTFAGDSGTLSIVTAQTPVPSSLSLAYSATGTNLELVFSGTNGVPYGEFVLLTTTNVSLPFSNWIPIFTNFYDSQGDFDFTNTVPTSEEMQSQFYILESQ